MQFIRKTVLGLALAGLAIQAVAQVQPSISAPSTLPGNAPVGQPRALPSQVPGQGTQTPGRSGTTPGRTGTTAPAQTGTRTTTPTTQQGANTNQQGGRTQQGQGAQPGVAEQGTVNTQQADSDTNAVSQTEQANALMTDTERLRQQELAAQRRKLFGYSIFNDPNNATSFQPNLNIATPKDYVVGTGDQLNINIYGYSEATYLAPVTPDGFVYIERIGPVHVAGLTIEQAKSRLITRMSKIYVGLKSSAYGPVNTYLIVTLGNIRSIRVTVTGEAIRPGTYTLSSLSTALNAIYQAGGPSELGSFRSVQVIRSNRVVATLDLYDYLITGIQRNDIRLQDNDNIRFSTYKSHVEITGSVRRNNIFEMLPGETMSRLLELSGGFSSNAYKARVKVTRFTSRELKVVDVADSNFPSFVMQDGDQAVVEAVLVRFENQISIQGAVFRPGNYSLDQNKTLKQLIANAEGLKGDAFTGRIQIIRTREDMAVENISLNLADIINGTAPDVELRREDQITIPSRFDMAELANVAITGEVNQPKSILYVSNMTLEDLLLQAGGLKESAAAAQIEVIRRKKDIDVTSTTAQIAETYVFNINRDLSIKSTDSQFFLAPFDQVIVRQSPNYQPQTYAAVEGEVMIPGEYPLHTKDQRISDLIQMAGGLSPFAYVEGATLVRPVQLSKAELEQRERTVNELANDTQKAVVNTAAVAEGSEDLIGINLKRIMANPGSEEDMILKANDILRIPKKLETVRIGGEVLLPTTTKFRRNQTFQDYISQAGGFTSRSARKRAYVVYANGSADRTRRFGFFNVYPRIEPGSEIIVPQQTGPILTPQQLIQSTTGILGSVMTLITAVLAFRALR